ncbi:BlaI/MecI/CopY family transcriptional regulator [Akkermansiaceae bacterium]|nr:BlaI/MecI/CopY family transcriptional regulator [Akkermansiaceae bacterium]
MEVDKPKNIPDPLTRRERQIMDVIISEGEVTARAIFEQIADPPSYSTVRTLLGVLLRKGHVKTHKEGKTLIYKATQSVEVVAESALKRMVNTFFKGSVERAVCGLIEVNEKGLSEEEAERLTRLIEQAKVKR